MEKGIEDILFFFMILRKPLYAVPDIITEENAANQIDMCAVNGKPGCFYIKKQAILWGVSDAGHGINRIVDDMLCRYHECSFRICL